MTKFKTGDRVERTICSNGTGAHVGMKGTVSTVLPDGDVYVSWDNGRANDFNLSHRLKALETPTLPVTFKVGDVIRNVSDTGTSNISVGNKYRVTKTGSANKVYFYDDRGYGRIRPAKDYVLVVEPVAPAAAPKPVAFTDDQGQFIVVLVEAGKLKPSATPYLHTSRTKAEAEAVRMAELHHSRFIVMQATFGAECAKPVKPVAKVTRLV